MTRKEMNKDNEQKQMKDLPQWLQTLWEISPMLARKAENDYINLKEQLRIGSVSQQRELLLGFYDWYLGQNPRLQNVKEQVIDEFLDQ